MIKYCFAYFNKLGDFYGQPFFTDAKEQFVKSLHQVLYGVKQDDLESLKEDDLYFIGSFDNESGEFTPVKEFICSMSGLCSEVLVKKYGVKEDGAKC